MLKIFRRTISSTKQQISETITQLDVPNEKFNNKNASIRILMQNARELPQGGNNRIKEIPIENTLIQERIDLGAFLESGVYNNKKADITIPFNKALANNIKENNMHKHKTPLGAGT